MPKVLIDLRMVRGALHGISRYALELTRRIPPREPGWQFIGLTGPDGLADDLQELSPRIPLVRCAAHFLSPFEQPALVASLLSVRPDLFHATSFSLPALWPGRLVATLHDATHLALTEGGSALTTVYYRAVVAPRAKASQALITVSEFSRDEIARHLRLPSARLQVIANGVDPFFRPATPSAIEAFCARRGLPNRYFAAVGNLKPHKNLRLLAMIAEQLPAPLVVLAGRGAKRELNFGPKTIELAALSDADLMLFYSGAVATLLPSRYEGFGLPALEAMACGSAVIAADAGAHREVVGGAGILIDPNDETAWLEEAQRIFRDDAARLKLVAAGLARSAQFTWDRCAEQTLAVYRRALS